MKLSFCITYMNRYDQIIKTLGKNLKDNLGSDVEFILVEFNNGKDNRLKDFILKNFKNHLQSNYLKYYYTDQLIYWHASIAKNTSHKLANGKYVVNLDCDNFTGPKGGEFVIKQFEKNGENLLLHQSSNIFGSGTMGRIGMTRENFLKLGGYNESLKPMAHQDRDLIERAKKIGLKYKNIATRIYNQALVNDKNLSTINCYKKYDYSTMMRLNKLISEFNIKFGEYKTNNIYKDLKIGVDKKYLQLVNEI